MRFSQHHKTAHSKRYKKLGQQVNHPTDFQKKERIQETGCQYVFKKLHLQTS
jgi:hypothetical protein